MKKLLHTTLLLSLTMLMGAAQTPQPPAASPSSSGDDAAKRLCKVEGQVLNVVTGEPVRKANLTLRPDAGGTNLKAASDNEGKFTIENIQPGRYTLAGDRQGFVTQQYGASRPAGPGTILELKESQVLKGIAFKLTPQGIIAGKVLDDEGEAVSGVSISALQYRYVMGKKRLISVLTTLVTSNDLGEYRVPNLSPGRYYIATSAQRLMDIQSGAERAAAKGEEEGPVTTYYPNSADTAGASPVDVGPGAEVRGIDLRLRRAKVFRVSGKLINANTGMPLNPGMVMLFRREAGGMSTFPSSMYVVQGDKGAFELRNVAPGPYSMLAMSANPQDMMLNMSSLDVTESNIENLTVNVGGGLEIPVTAKLEGAPSAPPPDNSSDTTKQGTAPQNTATDLSTIRIVLNVEENPMASLSTVQIGKDNKAVLKRVNQDKYRLIVTGLPEGTYLRAARYGDADVLENGLDLRQGGAGSLDLTVAGPAAQLIGVVHNDKGEPAPGAIVTLIPLDPKHRTDLSRTRTADQYGNVRIRGIVPGEYKVFAWEDIENGAAEDEDFRRPFDSRGTKVNLSTGNSDSVTLTMIPRAATEEEKTKH